MKKYLFLLFCLGIFATSHAQKKSYDVIAYYTGDAATFRKYPLQHLTQVIYSFLHLKGSILAFDNEKSKQNLLDIVALKKEYPSLKVLISLGGWGACYSCPSIFSTETGRDSFAISVLDILKQTNTDGIDLDWEYPTIQGPPGHPYSADDKANFTALIKKLRATLGNKYELSFAAGGFQKYLDESVDWDAIMPLVNRVNLMTYDLVGGYSIQTGHHTPLYSNAIQKESTDNCVQDLLRKKIPAEKLVIGAAFYARIWKDVANVDHGLYQSGVFKSGVDFKQFPTRLSSDSGYVEYWHRKSQAPYMYNASKNEFVTYDNKRSIQKKVKYMKKHQLGGIMFWELGNDSYSDGLLDQIHISIGTSK